MRFIIANTFTASLAKLTNAEQKAVKTTSFDLQQDPSNPGLRFHRIDSARDPNFWSIRVSRDIRIIVHRVAGNLLLCYVDHHDQAYRWAERRKLETHPKTGAAQLVELRETVKEIVIPAPPAARDPSPGVSQEGPSGSAQDREAPKIAVLEGFADDELLGFGVPPAWLEEVRRADEDELLELVDDLPGEAAEALIELATGGRPQAPAFVAATAARPTGLRDRPGIRSEKMRGVVPIVHERPLLSVADEHAAYDSATDPAATVGSGEIPPVQVGSDDPDSVGANIRPFDHPDAQRRFRVVADADELARALDYPWDRWAVFLHPAQRKLVEKDYSGPARVCGSAGTGKTIVALHRAVRMARNHPDARVLLTTFSDSLAASLRDKLRRLIGNQPRVAERLEVHALDSVGRRLYQARIGPTEIVPTERIRRLLDEARRSDDDLHLNTRFLFDEWEQVVDAWQLQRWEDYRDFKRLGRKTGLPEKHRAALWKVFARTKRELSDQGLTTRAELFTKLAARLRAQPNLPFEFVIVDEAQDVSVAQLRFLAVLGSGSPNSLFFAGDLGQRIFQTPFSWKSLGVDIRGRSDILRVNYRTSQQIRTCADRLLGPEVVDVDGNSESRMGAVSVVNGYSPVVRVFESEDQETEVVGAWVADRIGDGVAPEEICIAVRSPEQFTRAEQAARDSGAPFEVFDEHTRTIAERLSIGTMHSIKGLEFRAVAVMGCDDEVLPLQARIESVADESDLREVYDTERHLLYVACTRARDWLSVSGVGPASEFLDDLVSRPQNRSTPPITDGRGA